ncbi:MAG: flagellar export protein FliJ [Desulfurivibrio sp.]|jgi:flagellar FliJ protein|nr:MAG: flagellar export protein FliJ [Desulfurivibrio sp.]
MAFHFRLEAVLTLRKNLEEQAQLKLAREQLMLQRHQLRFAELQEKRRELCEAMEERKKKTMSGSLFLFYMEAMRIQELQLRILQTTIAAQQQVVEKVRSELAEAMKKRKTIEVLREKELQKYLQETRRREQNESDEQALLRHGRGILI